MEDKVKEIILSILEKSGYHIAGIIIEPYSNLRDDLGMDSFNLAELTVHIEEEFDIDIFEDGIVNTVAEIYAKLNT
jgi:acyl carrier protein